jgi:hypothetical protein
MIRLLKATPCLRPRHKKMGRQGAAQVWEGKHPKHELHDKRKESFKAEFGGNNVYPHKGPDGRSACQVVYKVITLRDPHLN